MNLHLNSATPHRRRELIRGVRLRHLLGDTGCSVTMHPTMRRAWLERSIKRGSSSWPLTVNLRTDVASRPNGANVPSKLARLRDVRRPSNASTVDEHHVGAHRGFWSCRRKGLREAATWHGTNGGGVQLHMGRPLTSNLPQLHQKPRRSHVLLRHTWTELVNGSAVPDVQRRGAQGPER